MSDTNLGVSITADTTDLNTKLALAKADMAAFTAETRAMAAQMRTAGDDGKATLLPQLQAAANSAASARAEVKNLTASVGEFGSTSHGSMATATREFRALFDELSSGRTRQTPGTLAIIGQRVFGLGPAALGAVGGIAALTAGLAYLAYQAYAAATAATALNSVAEFHGIQVGKAQIADYVSQLRKMGDVSLEEAQKVVASFLSMKNATPATIQFMIDEVQGLAKGFGETVPEAAKRMAAAFGDPAAKGDEFLQTLKAGPAVINAFDAALSKGDNVAAYSIMLKATAEATTKLRSDTEETNAKLREQVTILSALDPTGESNVAESAERLSKALNEIDTGKITKVAHDLAAAQADAATAPAAGASLAAVKQQLAQYSATHDATQQHILENEVATWQQRIAVGDLFGKELTEAQTSLARAETALRREAGQEAISATRDSLAAANAEGIRGRSETLQAEAATWRTLLEGDKLTATQRIEVQRSLNEALAQLHGAETQTANESIATQIARDQDYFAQKSAHIEELFNLGQLTASKEIAQLKQVADEEFAQLQRDYKEKLAFQTQDAHGQQQTYTELERLTAQHNAAMARLNNQGAKATQAGWKQAFQPITSAFDGMISGMVRGTETFQQAVAQMGEDLGIEFLKQQVKNVADWAVGEATKTAATTAGVASRTAVTAAGQAEGAAAQAAGAQKSILTAAYEAASGAYASASAIPYVGWILGPVAAAAAFIAVEGFGASIPSAAGGFDIPSGMNPLTQLHENEMVLPANLAGAVRGMAANGGAGGGGDTHYHTSVNVAGTNATPDQIAAAVRTAHRNFNPSLRSRSPRRH